MEPERSQNAAGTTPPERTQNDPEWNQNDPEWNQNDPVRSQSGARTEPEVWVMDYG